MKLYLTVTKRSIAAAACALALCTALTVFLAGTASRKDGTPLPIIMYHSVLKDSSRTGMYVVTPEKLESDLVWLRENGYETVSAREVIDHVKTGAPLPEKPVMLTFDDGFLNILTYVLPLLEKYGAKAVISVVGSYTEIFSDTPDPNPSYAHLTWDDIALLMKSGRVEIGNHSHSFHKQSPRKGTMRMSGESDGLYRERLTEDASRLQTALLEKCGFSPFVFTYPYGQISSGADDILKEAGFEMTLSCFELVNYISPGDRACLFSMGRFNRHGLLTSAQFMKMIS